MARISQLVRKPRIKQIERDAEKRAIETARYVIPIAAFTSMVHTVSGIVLHRLQRMVNTSDTPHEARLVIGEMVRLVMRNPSQDGGAAMQASVMMGTVNPLNSGCRHH